jgi:hypothetical protein
MFHLASAIDETTVAQVQAALRCRILRAFVGRGLLESFEVKYMPAYKHNRFSVDASVRIEAHDRAGLERLLRYCARPAFSMERLRKAGHELVYRCSKQRSEPSGDRRTGVDPFWRTPYRHETRSPICPNRRTPSRPIRLHFANKCSI